MTVVSAFWEVVTGGSQFQARQIRRSYLKNELKAKGLGVYSSGRALASHSCLGFNPSTIKKKIRTRCLWLTPVILATQEAAIRRMMV
jgi:hypothetical protein